jgi:hypothetical protein
MRIVSGEEGGIQWGCCCGPKHNGRLLLIFPILLLQLENGASFLILATSHVSPNSLKTTETDSIMRKKRKVIFAKLHGYK